MNLFRSRILAAFLAFVMAGLWIEPALGCCPSESHESSTLSEVPAHSESSACECFCHQTFVDEHGAVPFRWAGMRVLARVIDPPAFPPEPIPIGIDHPPQLS